MIPDENNDDNFKKKKSSKKLKPYGGVRSVKVKTNFKVTKTQKLEETNARRSYKKKARQQAKKQIDEEIN